MSNSSSYKLAENPSNSHLKIALIDRGSFVNAQFGATEPSLDGRPLAFVSSGLTSVDIPAAYQDVFDDLKAAFADANVDYGFQGQAFGGNGAFNGAWTHFPPQANLDAIMPASWDYDSMMPYMQAVLNRCVVSSTPSTDQLKYNVEAEDLCTNAMAGGAAGSANDPDMIFLNGTDGLYGRPAVSVTTDALRCAAQEFFKNIIDSQGCSLLDNMDILRGTDALHINWDTSSSPARPQSIVYTAVGDAVEQTLNVSNPDGRVILGAGALNSVKFLYNSGVGPVASQSTVFPSGPAFQFDVPDMGTVRDHFGSFVIASCPTGYTAFETKLQNAAESADFLNSRVGPFAQYGPVFATYSGNIEIWGTPHGSSGTTDSRFTGPDKLMLFAMHLAPQASILQTVNADGTFAYPNVYGNVPDHVELGDAFAQYLRDFFAANPTCSMSFGPGASGGPHSWMTLSDAHVRTYVQSWNPFTASDGVSVYYAHLILNHYMGTIPLGSAVNENTLELQDNVLSHLHVVDASIIPDNIEAHPHGLLLAIGEKAADLIQTLLPMGPSLNPTQSPTPVPTTPFPTPGPTTPFPTLQPTSEPTPPTPEPTPVPTTPFPTPGPTTPFPTLQPTSEPTPPTPEPTTPFPTPGLPTSSPPPPSVTSASAPQPPPPSFSSASSSLDSTATDISLSETVADTTSSSTFDFNLQHSDESAPQSTLVIAGLTVAGSFLILIFVGCLVFFLCRASSPSRRLGTSLQELGSSRRGRSSSEGSSSRRRRSRSSTGSIRKNRSRAGTTEAVLPN